MASLLLSGEVVLVKEPLDRVEGLPVDQRLVLSLVLDSPVADDSDVVGVLQHLVEGRNHNRLRWPLRRRLAQKASSRDLFEQVPDRPLTACIGPESPGNERRSFGVDLDRPDLSPVFDLAHVQIAHRCLAGSAAALRLLDQPLVDLVGEIP